MSTTVTNVIPNPSGQLVNTVAFTPSSRHFFSGDQGSDLRRWNAEGLAPQVGPTARVNGRLFCAVVSSDARWVVTGDDRAVIVWDAENHQRVLVISEPNCPTAAVDITQDSTRIASGSDDRQLRIFSRSTGQLLLGPLRHNNWVLSVKFSPSGDRIATAATTSVRVYNSQSGAILFDIPVAVTQWPVTALAWSPDGVQLFVSSPGRITRLDTSSPSPGSRSDWPVHSNDALVSIITNGRFIACSAGTSVSFWELSTGNQITVTRPIQHTAPIRCIVLSVNETYLACGFGANIAIHNLRDILPRHYFNNFIPLIRVSDEALARWTQGNLDNARTILSGEITPSNRNHDALANRSLVQAHLKQPALAIKDAGESLDIRQSPIGHIAMAVALLRQNDRDGAEATFNLAFHDCEPSDNRLLLLLQAILMFECGKQDAAIARVEYLLTRINDGAAYHHHQVLGAMRMRRNEHGPAITAFDRAARIAPSDGRSPPLVAITLIFGWTFNELDITARRRLYEITFAAGRTSEASGILSTIIPGAESRSTSDWLVDFHQNRVTGTSDAGSTAPVVVNFPG